MAHIDLAVAVDPRTQLVLLQRARDSAGLRTQLRLPDDDDPPGGVLMVWSSQADDGEMIDVVEGVNFRNPARSTPMPAPAAIARAQPLPGSSLCCATIEDLVALKLHAGGLSDLADVEQPLARNPDADLSAIRAVAVPFFSRPVERESSSHRVRSHRQTAHAAIDIRRSEVDRRVAKRGQDVSLGFSTSAPSDSLFPRSPQAA